LDVDDLSIGKVGVWPWSRDIMADGLILMKEFDAKYAVFDIEYTEESPRGINSSFLEDEIPDIFTNEFATIKENISALVDAISAGRIKVKDAKDYISDISSLTDASKKLLLDKITEISRDNDKYLGQAALFFGNAIFTVNMLAEIDEDVPADLKEWALKNVGQEVLTDNSVQIQTVLDIRPAIMPVIGQGMSAGFPNIVVDEDGYRRRVDLIIKYKDKYFTQLSFTALLEWLGNPQIILKNRHIILKQAQLPGQRKKDISIPLTGDMKFLINWPPKKFEESFRHLSYYYLVLHNRQEKQLLRNLKVMRDAGYLNYYEGSTGLLDAYNYAEEIKKKILNETGEGEIQEYKEVRRFFFDELGKFLNGKAESAILSDVDNVIATGEISPEDLPHYLGIKKEVTDYFSACRDIYTNLMKTRKVLSENLKDAFCIIGNTGTSTTDRGVNPFDKDYDNVGTHASVVNTILAEKFLDELPMWYSIIIAVALTFIVFFIIRKLNPLPSIIVGLSAIIVLIAVCAAIFITTGIYVPILAPLIAVVIDFVALTIFKFLVTAQEKSFIRNAFGHYLSTDVINELLNDPEKLALGGQKKNLTAMFTDVKGFSTVSEKLDPTELVKLLNMYLTDMSDTILSLRGTIDKYEGDAIIAFFGAPVEFNDHPRRACEAAMKMKKIERVINERFLAEKLSPTPLLTRIGINTGEMVVGNMGTAQKMDYTIMGNSVNLASRLEGVNKQYGTWVLMSDATYEGGGKDFTVRKLDRVRVVGINQPVRLYELIDEKSQTDAKTVEALDIFHVGLALFEEKHWEEALKVFEKALAILPDDGPANVFIKRCNEFIAKPPADSWDGVFSLTVK
ncbi:MAG: adenylate/guanylate cyclase domain-containing protein, partial [Spirochaetota bacterium]